MRVVLAFGNCIMTANSTKLFPSINECVLISGIWHSTITISNLAVQYRQMNLQCIILHCRTQLTNCV
jgi:hypothetical protein